MANAADLATSIAALGCVSVGDRTVEETITSLDVARSWAAKRGNGPQKSALRAYARAWLAFSEISQESLPAAPSTCSASGSSSSSFHRKAIGIAREGSYPQEKLARTVLGPGRGQLVPVAEVRPETPIEKGPPITKDDHSLGWWSLLTLARTRLSNWSAWLLAVTVMYILAFPQLPLIGVGFALRLVPWYLSYVWQQWVAQAGIDSSWSGAGDFERQQLKCGTLSIIKHESEGLWLTAGVGFLGAWLGARLG